MKWIKYINFIIKEKGPVKRTRNDLYQGVDVDYYGYRDEDDGLLVKLEKIQEDKGFLKLFMYIVINCTLAFARAIAEWEDNQIKRFGSVEASPFNPRKKQKIQEEYKVHVELPSDADVEERILELRKKVLYINLYHSHPILKAVLRKYVGE